MTKWVQLIGHKKFVAAALDSTKEAFVMYIASLSLNFKMTTHLAWKAQIALLVVKKVTVLAKYLDYSNIFSKKSVVELSKHSDINEHSINLESDK